MLSGPTLFTHSDFLLKFKADILDYCQSQRYQLQLTDAEIEHLSWNVGNNYVSPEAGKNSNPEFPHLPFEIKRSLARCYSFVLLLRGNETDYREFIQAQDQSIALSFDEFRALSGEAKRLEPDAQTVIRATSFLLGSNALRRNCRENMTDAMREALVQNQLPEFVSEEGEEFISQFAILAAINPAISPITKAMSKAQNALLIKAYWPNLHMRWLYSTEGANNMTQSLANAVRDGQFNQDQDFAVWLWRWRLNVAGFQGGPAAKFYDSKSHHLIELMLAELRKLFVDHDYPFLEHYLQHTFQESRLPVHDLSSEDINFVAHLITYLAYFHRVDIFKAENADALLAAYCAAKKDGVNAAAVYALACGNQRAVTPTYVPGVMDTALGLFKSYLDALTEEKDDASLPAKIDMTALFKAHPQNTAQAIFMTVQFMTKLSEMLYSDALAQRVSCMALAKIENLKPVLEAWINERQFMRFTLAQGVDGMELKAAVSEEAKLACAFNSKSKK